jgi:hypothetical protein
MYCVFCGRENPDYASFCEQCGKSVNRKENPPSLENTGLEGASEKNECGPAHSSSGPFGEQVGPVDPVFDARVREFQKTYGEMSDEDLLRLAADIASLTEPAREAFESELSRRGLERGTVPEYNAEAKGRDSGAAKEEPTQKKYRFLWMIPVWYVALLLYNGWSHWSQDADKNTLYKFAAAIGQLTTPLELLLSAAVVYTILSRKRANFQNSEARNLRRRFFSHPAFHTICILGGTVFFLLVILMVVGPLQRSSTKQADNPSAQSTHPGENAPVNPNALDDYEIMSKSKADLGTSTDGLTPQAKKRMREMFALEFAGAMQKQNNPLHVEVIGDDHDILSLQLPSMNEEASNDLIQRVGEGDANFWNGLRLMNFSELVFSGDDYKKIVAREEIVRYSKNYDEYKAAFLKSLKGIQTGAQGEVKKP